MAEISFERKTEIVPTPVEGVGIACETTVCDSPAVENNRTPDAGYAVARQGQAMPVAPTSLVLGDKLPEFKDIILPRLNIVQGSGELKDSFPQGSVVFGQSLVIFTPPVISAKTGSVEKAGSPPAIITVLGFRPDRFLEKVKGGVGGMIVDSEEQVTAAGGTLNYREWEAKQKSGMKLFQPLADAVVVIERPEAVADDDTVFCYECDGKKYALALWGLKGTSYTQAAKGVFFTARAVGCLRGGYPTYSYALSTRTQSKNGNTWFIPVCIPHKKSTPEFLAFAASILNSPA